MSLGSPISGLQQLNVTMPQQARNVCWDLVQAGVHPTVLLRDRDATFASSFDAVFTATGVRVARTPAQTRQANAFAERWAGTVRRECLDWLLITRERHLRQVLHVYGDHYNAARTHRALQLQPPLGPPAQRPGSVGLGAMCRRDRLGGVLHEYEPVAA